jgi:hypothetical protein
MITCFSALANLKEISLEFQYPVWFKGDDLVARINTPRLNYLYICGI